MPTWSSGAAWFEKFCEGRPVEEMTRITQRICGVCPIAHHMAAAKAGDAVYHVEPPPAGKKLRELLYASFFVADHATHFYVLGGPDFVVGPEAPKSERNILGVVRKVGREIGAQVMQLLGENHEIAKIIAGRYIHAVSAIIGGMSKPITEDERKRIEQIARNSIKTAQFSLKLFDDVVLKNKQYLDMVLSDAFTHQTYYMGLWMPTTRSILMMVRARCGSRWKRACQIQPGTIPGCDRGTRGALDISQIPISQAVGWKGFVDGKDSGVYRASPLSRLKRNRWHANALSSERI